MHLVDLAAGFLGATPIVGSTIPSAVGAAFGSVMKGENRVTAIFFGDAATEEGVFYESINFAALKKLPVLFVCENNLYSSHIHIRDRRPADNIPEAARAACIPAVVIDGNDVVAVYQTMDEAVARARSGGGPSFIECRTYRWRGHVGPNWDVDKGLRSQEEVDQWVARCPIKALEGRLVAAGILDNSEMAALRAAAVVEVAEAMAFARQSPLPQPSEVLDYLFQ